MKQNDNQIEKPRLVEKPAVVDRRKFLKISAISGAITAVGAGLGKSTTALAVPVTHHKSIDDVIEIDSKQLKRFHPINTMFIRSFMRDKGFEHIAPTMMKKAVKDELGYSQLDRALLVGSGFLSSKFTGPAPNGFGFGGGGVYSWKQKLYPEKYKFESPEAAVFAVKKAALTYGASLVGIAPHDERWLYTHSLRLDRSKKPPVVATLMEDALPFTPKSVVVLGIEMDYELSKYAPTFIGTSMSQMGYSEMARIVPSLANFIQQLGYKAIPIGNDTYRNVPMAIAAGLGESSRMGMLITEKFGPRIRLCGVATEMELPTDQPVTFGVTDFCKVCMKCADSCPADAISREPEPTFEGQHNRSNSVGVKKWHTDGEKCVTFWGKNHIGCSNCISCCPYNKLDNWNHDFAKLATVIPGMKYIARDLDESFGYGKVFNNKAIKEFWKK